MKRRKWLAIALALVLGLGLLAGCGESKENGKEEAVSIEEVKEESAAVSEKSEPAPAEEKSEPAPAAEEKSEPAQEEKEEEAAPEPAKEEAEGETAESLMNGYYDVAEDIRTIAFDMLLDLDMTMDVMGSASANAMKMDIHYENDGENAYMTGLTESETDGESDVDEVEQYVVMEDGEAITYAYDKDSKSWSRSEGTEVSITHELIPKVDPSAFTMEEEGGRYKVSGSLEMGEILENSSDTLKDMFESFIGSMGSEFSGKADLDYYFNKETKALEEVSIDMTAVLEETFKALIEAMMSQEPDEEEMDVSGLFKIDIDSFAMRFSNIAINEDMEIVLPKEAADLKEDEDKDDSEDEKKEASGDDKKSASSDEFEPFTPIDNDECSVTVKELDPEGSFGYSVKLGLENKTKDKKLEYYVQTAFINGLEASAYFYTDVAAGKKSNDGIDFDASELEEYGIGEVTDIELTIRVQNADDWSGDPVAEETFHIYPKGEKNAEKYVRKAQKTDNVLIDDENVSVIVTGQEMDDIWGYTVNIYIENKTDKQLMFSVEDASINGYMADPFFARVVYPEKSSYGKVAWSETTLEENGITEVEEIEFKLKAYDYSNWSGDDLFSETFTLKP